MKNRATELPYYSEVNEIIDAAARRKLSREEAGEKLAALGPNAVEAVVAQVRLRRQTDPDPSERVALLFSWAVVFSAIEIGSMKQPIGRIAIDCALMLALALVISVILRRWKYYYDATWALFSLDHSRVIPHLSDSLFSYKPELRRASTEALTRLLPKVKASDAAIFNSAVRNNLRLALMQRGPDLAVAILTALEQVGGEEDIAAVANMAHYRQGRAAKSDEVRRAAERLLPVLMEKVERDRAGGSLLRAADAPEPDGATLLCAAAAGAQTGPDALLRQSVAPTCSGIAQQ